MVETLKHCKFCGYVSVHPNTRKCPIHLNTKLITKPKPTDNNMLNDMDGYEYIEFEAPGNEKVRGNIRNYEHFVLGKMYEEPVIEFRWFRYDETKKRYNRTKRAVMIKTSEFDKLKKWVNAGCRNVK